MPPGGVGVGAGASVLKVSVRRPTSGKLSGVRAALLPEKSGEIKATIPIPINTDKKFLFMSILPPLLFFRIQLSFSGWQSLFCSRFAPGFQLRDPAEVVG